MTFWHNRSMRDKTIIVTVSQKLPKWSSLSSTKFKRNELISQIQLSNTAKTAQCSSYALAKPAAVWWREVVRAFVAKRGLACRRVRQQTSHWSDELSEIQKALAAPHCIRSMLRRELWWILILTMRLCISIIWLSKQSLFSCSDEFSARCCFHPTLIFEGHLLIVVVTKKFELPAASRFHWFRLC